MKNKTILRVISFVLIFCMLVGVAPVNAFAAPKKDKKPAVEHNKKDNKKEKKDKKDKNDKNSTESGIATMDLTDEDYDVAVIDEDALQTALDKAKTYIDGITINNSQNDPATVVKNFKTHFTWDNEKRENDKSYLFDWSYYNGVVFEGIEYLYNETKEDVYGDYVEEYMSSLIASNGTWAKCSNNSSKECAGYNSTHGADCYKTASLLLDMYKRTNDSRYLTMAATLYADLDTAANKYLLKNAGNNYRHTWSSDPSPDLWLDGLYMILPFRAEYAKHIGDTEELDLIVDRMQWVSDNMYNKSKGLFYHAADSATSNSGSYWLRAIGWYAAAIVDVMDSMEGENLEAMKKQLVKLVDGMKACQNPSNGMWLNNMAISQSSTNPYETSGTALTCYAVMKAVNEGWLDASYADMAILAFEGICNEKIVGSNLKDICFKGAPGSGNSTFYDNEGKGLGPFIMFYAEMLEYKNNLAEVDPETPVEPEVPVEPETPEVTVEDTTIKVENVTGLTGTVVKTEDKALIEKNAYENFVAFDVTATKVEGKKAVVSIPVPAEWNATEERLVGISVEDGVVKEIKGTLSEDGKYTFEVDHFSAKGIALLAENGGYGFLYSIGEKVTKLESGNYYLLQNDRHGGYLTDTIADRNKLSMETSSEVTSNNLWYITSNGNSYTVQSGSQNGSYLTIGDGTAGLSNDSISVSFNYRNNGFWDIAVGNQYLNRYNATTNFAAGWRQNAINDAGSCWNIYKVTKSRVNLSVSSDTVSLVLNASQELTATITLEGATVNTSNIAWKSSNTDVVTVKDGKVTGVSEGTADIIVTLNSVNNKKLENDIVIRIPVSVTAKQIISTEIVGNNGVTVNLDGTPDFSNIKLLVTYEAGETDETVEYTTNNGLKITGYDTSKLGYTYATISYNGVDYGVVRVTVAGNPYEKLEDATYYPEYPEDGAVRIDKYAHHDADEFEDTGVTRVELSVAGVSVKKGVDVVLVADISNSMAWFVGASEGKDADKIAEGNEATKWDELQKATGTFVDVLFEDNLNNSKNTISFVTFGGFDKERNNNTYNNYADSVQTHFVSYNNAANVKEIVNRIEINGALSGSNVNYTISGMSNGNGAAQGGTNYDYAFLETATAIERIKTAYANANQGKSYDESGREIFVVFMTDGAPDHYNQLYYKKRSDSQFDYYALYKNSTDKLPEEYFKSNTLPTGKSFNQRQKPNGYYIPTSDMQQSEWVDWITGDSLYAAEYVSQMESVDSINAIGFDLTNGTFGNYDPFGMNVLNSVLTNLAGNNSCDVHLANDADELNQFYKLLATKISFAGTSAQVTDIIDSKFTLQTAAFSGSGEKTAILKNRPMIAVTAYDLYTKLDAEVDSQGNDLTGARKDSGTPLEVVQFSEDGTKAYSDMVANGSQNIMSISADGSVVIEAFYFTYTKEKNSKNEWEETFEWKLGNITDKEVTLGFDAYLKGALEGEAKKGIYYTNEEASLEYIDINGYYAKQDFPVPHVIWGGASTTVRFYLVNEKGQPVNQAGVVVSPANRIYVGEPVIVTFNLNEDLNIDSQQIRASAHVPPQYILYDNNAYYTIQPASGDIVKGSLVIAPPSPDAGKTTQDLNGNLTTQDGDAQTTVLIRAEEAYYTWSEVGFGVRWNHTREIVNPLNPDQIVIDYGKDIQEDVLANDTGIVPSTFTSELVGFVEYDSNINTGYAQLDAGSEELEGQFGTFTIVNGTVNYSLNTMLSGVEKVFCVIKVTEIANTDNYHYRYSELDVIPAPEMYYEDDFAGVIEYTNGAHNWQKYNVNGYRDNSQDDGTVGTNDAYGFDESYNDDTKFSNGSATYIEAKEGDGYNITYATFTFTGTGFDLISYTSTKSGVIRAEIFQGTEVGTRSDIYKYAQVSNVGASILYQIPVLSCEDMPYGTYTVRVHVYEEFTHLTIPALNREGLFVFDALRIYDPIDVTGSLEAGSDAAIAQAAYLADSEAFDKHFEVREAIIAAADFDALTEGTEGDGVVYIDASAAGNTVENAEATVYDYIDYGPNNETYLMDGYSIAFILNVKEIPTSIQIGAKSVLGSETSLWMYLENPDDADIYADLMATFEHATSQNYSQFVDMDGEPVIDLSPYFIETEDGYQTYVYIQNEGDGVETDILSLTDFKATFQNESEMWVTYNNDLLNAYNLRHYEPVTKPEDSDVKLVTAAFTTETVRTTKQAVLEVVSTDSVEQISIIGEDGKAVSATTKVANDEQGQKYWTFSFKIGTVGVKTYNVYGIGADGTVSDPVTVTIEATKR